MKKFFYLILIIFSHFTYATQLQPGDEVAYPIMTSARWLNTSSNGNGADLEFSYTFQLGILMGVYRDGQAKNNPGAVMSVCARDSSGYCPNNNVNFSGQITCLTDDGLNFQACLKRYVGQTFTAIVRIPDPKNAVCLDVSAKPILTGSSGWDIIGGWLINNYYCGEPGTVIPVYPTSSVCSINSQELNLSYSSTNLNVSGLTKSTNLVISCTEGDTKDYKLKLTGSKVTNGRLSFGNGVSAQVSLNGIQVQANGSGIQLNGLTTSSIPVSATLAGTAATSGSSNASGVLVLEAQ